MCSPDATNGVATCGISPPSKYSVRIASATTSNSRTPGRMAWIALSVTASAIALASCIAATSAGSLFIRAVCMAASPSHTVTFGRAFASSSICAYAISSVPIRALSNSSALTAGAIDFS